MPTGKGSIHELADDLSVYVWLLLISNNKKNGKCLDIGLRVKHRSSLIVKLKAIKYKEDILSYLSSYTIFIFLAQYFLLPVKY